MIEVVSNLACSCIQHYIQMICINQKKNHKLLETFNNDPYFDITISTATTQLNLVLGYLSIDSQFFEKVVPDTKQINLQHLPEGPTIKVLRALYGQQLYAFNVKELVELYKIIEYLEIREYKQNIIQYIKSHTQLMDSLELLEFCYQHDILVEEMNSHHFSSNLSVLSSSKNYLQLSKITQETLNQILLGFIDINTPDITDPIINSILQNYFGRNDIRPNDYFIKSQLQPLRLVWEKYHHSINYLINTQQKIRQSQIMNNNMSQAIGVGNSVNAFGNPIMYTSNSYYQDPRKSLIMTSGYSIAGMNFSYELQEKDKEIMNLQKMLQLKNQIIKALKSQIQAAKKEIGKGSMHQLASSDEEQNMSMLEEVKKSKKERDSLLSSEYDVSLIEPAFDQDRRLDQNREVKTMNKLNTRTKKIFN